VWRCQILTRMRVSAGLFVLKIRFMASCKSVCPPTTAWLEDFGLRLTVLVQLGLGGFLEAPMLIAAVLDSNQTQRMPWPRNRWELLPLGEGMASFRGPLPTTIRGAWLVLPTCSSGTIGWWCLLDVKLRHDSLYVAVSLMPLGVEQEIHALNRGAAAKRPSRLLRRTRIFFSGCGPEQTVANRAARRRPEVRLRRRCLRRPFRRRGIHGLSGLGFGHYLMVLCKAGLASHRRLGGEEDAQIKPPLSEVACSRGNNEEFPGTPALSSCARLRSKDMNRKACLSRSNL
jgi:hypothetical protein